MKKENLEKIWEDYCVKARGELSSTKDVKGNVIEIFCEVKWDESGIVEISVLNEVGMKNISNGETSEFEKDELYIFNKNGKVDRNTLKPMNLNLNSYCTFVPALVSKHPNNMWNIVYPNMNILFNN